MGSFAALPGLAGCALGGGSGTSDVAYYDLGAELVRSTGPRLSISLAIDEVSAGASLQTQAILYRLSYRDPAPLHAYSRSRWTEPPAALLTRRLRLALVASNERGVTQASDGVTSERILKAELLAFEQVVLSPSSGQAVVRLHVSLIDSASRRLQAQRGFALETPCESIDAPGAVRALRAATDTLTGQVIDWLAAAAGK
jgi:cholesterol transport system auxiliary component